MNETATLDDIAVYQIHAGDGDGADLVMDFNGQRIPVSVFPSSSAPFHCQKRNEHTTIQDRLLDILSRATSAEVDDDEYDEMEEEAVGIILDAGRPFFIQTPSLDKEHKDHPPRPNPNLHSAIFLATLFFNFMTVDGHATVVPIDSGEAYTPLTVESSLDDYVEDDLGIDFALPRYSSKQVLISETFGQGASYVGRVQVDGEEMLCKAQGGGGQVLGSSIGRELACLHEIRRAFQSSHDPVKS